MKSILKHLQNLTLISLIFSSFCYASSKAESSSQKKKPQKKEIIKRPKGKSPESICGKVLYWNQVRYDLFQRARNFSELGDLYFSRRTQILKKKITSLTEKSEEKQVLEELIENNKKMNLNFSERIVRNVFYGKVEDVQKAKEKAKVFAKILMERGTLLYLIKTLEIIECHVKLNLEKLLRALIKQNYGKFTSHYLPKHLKKITRPILRGLLTPEIYSILPNHALFCGGIIIELLRLTEGSHGLSSENLERIHRSIVNKKVMEKIIVNISSEKNFSIRSQHIRVLDHIFQSPYFKNIFEIPVPKNHTNSAEEKRNIREFYQFIDSFHNLAEENCLPHCILRKLYNLLIFRSNHNLMMNYISRVENLDWILTQGESSSEKTLSEVQGLLTFFILNPTRESQMLEALISRKEKILTFLELMLFKNFNKKNKREIESCIEKMNEI